MRTFSRCSTVSSGKADACPVRRRVPARVPRRVSVSWMSERLVGDNEALNCSSSASSAPGQSENFVRRKSETAGFGKQ